MSYENLLYEKRERIGFITFNRPKVLNALNRRTMEELNEILTVARDDEDIRVLILTGAGEKSFIAGADIGDLAVQTPVSGRQTALFGQGVLRRLELMGKPSIAAISFAVLTTRLEFSPTVSVKACVASGAAPLAAIIVSEKTPPVLGAPLRTPDGESVTRHVPFEDRLVVPK